MILITQITMLKVNVFVSLNLIFFFAACHCTGSLTRSATALALPVAGAASEAPSVCPHKREAYLYIGA